MDSTKKLARLIGLLYVLLSIPGIYGLLYVPSHLKVSKFADPIRSVEPITPLWLLIMGAKDQALPD